jgi:hypothetical protein
VTTKLSRNNHDKANTITHDGAHDFDFWMGRWKIKNRKLVKFLVGSKEWETFEATCHASLLPAGVGNVDDFVPINWRPGFVGVSLRLFNRDTGKWSIYWLNNKNAGMQGTTGHLAPPVVGEFKDGVGVFTGREMFDGVPIIVKYVWSNITLHSARWHQEFSTDEGKTWELNWIMEHTRVEN